MQLTYILEDAQHRALKQVKRIYKNLKVEGVLLEGRISARDYVMYMCKLHSTPKFHCRVIQLLLLHLAGKAILTL